ncbi:hypothetical protein CVT24_003920 [Panaeolus cyanescens]|uniref:Uncharacterized protein n=1 Tax=Panaeolus cyanescens TaxID=181874 RepID=A0A409W890_9AGAR|nr:hypothetical protein CVT24_003920 [Panaeolus cyanescens]
MRLYALYERKKSVLGFLAALIISEIICHIYVVTRLGPMVTRGVFTVPWTTIPISGCLNSLPPGSDVRFTLIAWIPPIFISLTFFAMMIYKIRSKIFNTIVKPSPSSSPCGTSTGTSAITGLSMRMRFSPLLKSFWIDGVSSFVLVSGNLSSPPLNPRNLTFIF